MNTMKKDDITKELEQCNRVVCNQAAMFFAPLIQIISAITRKLYLEEELRKVTPRPAPQKAPPSPENPEAKIELKEEKDEPIQENSN